jgi:uncharacterized protein
MPRRRFVFDTNTLVSAACFPGSFGRKALDLALRNGGLFASQATLAELIEVLTRPKFDRYMDVDLRIRFFGQIRKLCEIVATGDTLNVARDIDDNKFLELALAARADFIVTRDKDLLVLDPFNGIRVVEAEAFVRTAVALGLSLVDPDVT